MHHIYSKKLLQSEPKACHEAVGMKDWGWEGKVLTATPYELEGSYAHKWVWDALAYKVLLKNARKFLLSALCYAHMFKAIMFQLCFL